MLFWLFFIQLFGTASTSQRQQINDGIIKATKWQDKNERYVFAMNMAHDIRQKMDYYFDMYFAVVPFPYFNLSCCSCICQTKMDRF